jgi:hypothetical protein
MGEWKRGLPPAVAAVCVLIGLLVLDWVVIDTGGLGTLHVSPTGADLCFGSACADARVQSATWRLLSKLALGAGVLGSVGLGIVAVLRFLGADPAYFGKAASGLCAATVAFSVVALIAIAPDSMSDYSAGGLLTVVAAAYGITVRVSSVSGAFDGGRSHVPIRSTAVVNAPAGVAAPPTAAVVAPRPASRSDVRFVVVDGTITPEGLNVRLERGVERTLAWRDIVEVAARRLPPDPPHDKATFVDLVTTTAPVRLVQTSRLDYAALPSGMAPNTRENWRRLVALARGKNPAIVIETESADFFAGGRDAPMFTAFKKFQEWDSRYG